jgi:hypothetical protein
MKRSIEITGIIISLIGLVGLPWYLIKIRVTREIFYVFSYSPFRLLIKLGDNLTSEYFYRYDTSIIGLILLLLIITRVYKNDSKKISYLAPLGMIFITLIFVSLLPIHVATASRLSIGIGTYLIIIGAIILFTANFIS